jgi:alpha-L-fucosidase
VEVPSGPSPSTRQLRHHERAFYGFVHFTTNTFTDKEWGFGDEPPSIFDPSAFDADQIVDSARLAGMQGLILTCKHHDGFCLWPSELTGHSVRNSPFRNGNGDVVRELERACRSAGIEFGVYLSPWDRNHAEYGRPAYLDYYRGQLRELLTNYGELFEVWFDGANGGDGYYGGAREQRSIDNRTYYDWPRTWQMVRDLQPDAVIFSDTGPDVRWVGNESGIAGDPCWYTIDTTGAWPGQADRARLNRGDCDGPTWLIPECDVSIRPGWFYHAAEDEAVRSPRNLVDLYFASVGRGANFLLNLPPDRRGLIPETDRASLAGFRSHLDRTFATNLAERAEIERTTAGHSMTINLAFAAPQRVNVIELRERIAHGQRIGRWLAEAEREDGRWVEIASVEAVGAQRLIRVPQTTAKRFRVRVTDSRGEPLIEHVGLYLEPDLADTATEVRRVHAASVTQLSPVELVFDLGAAVRVRGVRYMPSIARRVSRYELSFATTPENWSSAVLSGEFGNVMANAAPQIVPCDVTARYVRFRATRMAVGDDIEPKHVELL